MRERCAGGAAITHAPPALGEVFARQLAAMQRLDRKPTGLVRAVQEGQRASVDGMVNRDGTFGEATITFQN